MCSNCLIFVELDAYNEEKGGTSKLIDHTHPLTQLEQVTETADFQKDLNLDSLDRVELVMAFEQEFSIEIPDDKADKLTCCADVAKYIVSGTEQKP